MIVTLLLMSLVLLVVYVGSQQLSGLTMSIVFMVAIIGITLVVSPQLASLLARALGVGRGTDLVLYIAVIGGLFGTAYFFVRVRRLERRVTQLTRAVALRDVIIPSDESNS